MNANSSPTNITSGWTWAAVYKSNTVRALAVALVAWALNMGGADEAAGSAAQLVDTAFNAVQGIAMLWALYARTRQPTPPLALTQKAADALNAAAIPAPPMQAQTTPTA